MKINLLFVFHNCIFILVFIDNHVKLSDVKIEFNAKAISSNIYLFL